MGRGGGNGRQALGRAARTLALTLALVGAAAPAAAASACAGPAPGGDWPLPGHDLANTRSQPAATTLTPSRAGRLRRVWSFGTGQPYGVTSGELSEMNGTPIEAGGCVFVGTAATAASNVYALDADTGAVVWRVHLDAGAGALGGAIPGSLASAGGLVYALVNRPGDGAHAGPYVAALDARTGAVRWRSVPIATAKGDYTNASPTVGRGIVVAGFSAPEGDPRGQGGVALLNARTGRLLAVVPTVPRDRWGTFAGGGVWTTPAIDAASGDAFYGTGNPFSKRVQDPRTDAILKLDIDRRRPTFGRVTGFYSGNIEQASEGLRRLSGPTCTLLPDSPLGALPTADPRLQELQGLTANSVGCLQLDLDFGAAPNLLRAADGRLLVGDLQKSGVYHVVDAARMTRAWWSLLGASCQVCNGASTAYDAGRATITGAVSPGSLLTAVAADGGRLRWVTPVGDAFHYEAVSTARGVVYTTDGLGFLDVVRASDGAMLLRRPLLADAGADAIPPGGYNSSGVAIARDTVYVEAGGHVVAYR